MNITPQAIIATIKINLFRRPLWKPEIVQECLGLSRDKVIELIESGGLAWAWNVGIGHRREIRILAHCVVERQSGVIPAIGGTQNLKLPEVLNLLLPQNRQQLRGTELQRVLDVDPDQIRKLHRFGELSKIREKLPKCGPNASPHYTRESVVKFFENRRIA